jgi:hypothetical protein
MRTPLWRRQVARKSPQLSRYHSISESRFRRRPYQEFKNSSTSTDVSSSPFRAFQSARRRWLPQSDFAIDIATTADAPMVKQKPIMMTSPIIPEPQLQQCHVPDVWASSTSEVERCACGWLKAGRNATAESVAVVAPHHVRFVLSCRNALAFVDSSRF